MYLVRVYSKRKLARSLFFFPVQPYLLLPTPRCPYGNDTFPPQPLCILNALAISTPSESTAYCSCNTALLWPHCIHSFVWRKSSIKASRSDAFIYIKVCSWCNRNGIVGKANRALTVYIPRWIMYVYHVPLVVGYLTAAPRLLEGH